MVKKNKILVLTDHSKHSEQNSVYAILQEMRIHRQCISIHVASRGLEENNSFFNEMREEQLFAATVDASFRFTEEGTYMKEGLGKVNPLDFNLVIMRLPRPISDDFLLWLEKIFARAIIINKPSGIKVTSSKAFLLNFPDQCPEMKLCKSVEDVMQSANRQAIVLKPLREYGGKGILKINGLELDNGNGIHNSLDYLQTISKELEQDGYLAMKYLKNVNQGDKRILVVDGEIMAASLRLPPEGSWLCNVSQGGTSVMTDITEREIEIIKAINPKLKEMGILIYGADTLVDDDGTRILSELNTLSIGGWPQAQAQTGQPIIQSLINKIMNYTNNE